MNPKLIIPMIFLGCAGSPPPISWPAVAQCGQPAAADLLSSVVGLLADSTQSPGGSIGDRAVSQLEHLAQAHGPSIVACLVSEAVAGFERVTQRPRSRAMTATVNPEVDQASFAAARGRDFLQRVAGTRIETP